MSHSEIISLAPHDETIVWRGPASTPADTARAVIAARQAFAGWSYNALEERLAIANRFCDVARSKRSEFAELIAHETGKPLWEALSEVDGVIAKVGISIAAQAERAGSRFVDANGVRSALNHRPHGVLAVLGPFNFPAHLPNGHIVPALIAGNVVIFKPSEKAPASGLYLARLWEQAGLPDGVLQVLIGQGELGRALVEHDAVDGILFTGSVETGCAINRAVADQPGKIVALELGGNNPLIAWDVGDVEVAAHLIAQSAFISAGQRCSCARRLIISEGARGEAIVAALHGLVDRLRIGGPFDDPPPFMGPVIDREAASMLLAAQQRLVERGGIVLRPLERVLPNHAMLRPGLIDVTQSTLRFDEEYFGPLLQVVRVADFDAAIAEANATRFGLAAGLIGRDADQFVRFRNHCRAGVVNWNRPMTGASSAMPFGGVGASGNHRPSAYYAADYCAYPVASMTTDQVSFRIETGLEFPL